jgi:hypothetical protein
MILHMSDMVDIGKRYGVRNKKVTQEGKINGGLSITNDGILILSSINI